MQTITSPVVPLGRKRFRKYSHFQYTLAFLSLVVAIIVSLFTIQPEIQFNAENNFTLFTFLCIGIYTLCSLYFSAYRNVYSLDCAHWVFMFFFFFYAPFVQFETNNFPGQTDLGAFVPFHLQTNGLVLLWCVCYSITYHIVDKKRRNLKEQISFMHSNEPNYFYLVILSMVATAFVYLAIGASGMMARTYTDDSTSALSSPVMTIAATVGRAVPVAALTILIIYGRKQKASYYAALALILMCTIASDFPASTSRFWTGALAFGLICLLVTYRRQSGIWLPIAFFFGFIVAMPFLNLFRTTSVQDADVGSYKQSDLSSVVSGGDFDAYTMLLDTTSYINRSENITMGRQLVGNLLFFVPRTMWLDKPGSSAGPIEKDTRIDGANLSEPLLAEGLINFGQPGLVLYAIFFAWLYAWLDTVYWNQIASSRRYAFSLIRIVYPFLVGFMIFFMRGAFLSSFAYTMGYVVAGGISLWVSSLASPKVKAAKNENGHPEKRKYAH